MINIIININSKNHQIKYTGALYYMFEEFRIEKNLPEQNTVGSIGICNIPVKDFLKQVTEWALTKYNMKVLPIYKDDRVVESIIIGFENMTESEVDEVFLTLFQGPECC